MIMEVCYCMDVTCADIKECLDAGNTTFNQLNDVLGVGTGCGGCISEIKDYVVEYGETKTISCLFRVNNTTL